MNEQTIRISKTKPGDREAILGIARGTGVFSDEEVATVNELLDSYFNSGAETSGYTFLSEIFGSEVLGFACYGPRPLTEGTYDLYWLAVNRASGQHGQGKRLVSKVMQKIKRSNGRLLVAETSGKPEYAHTRQFYLKQHFEQAAVISDFYAPGDDLIIFIRRV